MIKNDIEITNEVEQFINRNYHKLDGYIQKYNSCFEGNKDDIRGYLHEVLIKSAISYFKLNKNDKGIEEAGHLSYYVRGYMASHIKKYKSDLDKNKLLVLLDEDLTNYSLADTTYIEY